MHLVEPSQVLVVISGERGTETVEAVCARQAQVEVLFAERGVRKGANPHFPDEFWGRNDFNGGLDQWTVVSAPFRQ